jgi:hypothetical protein
LCNISNLEATHLSKVAPANWLLAKNNSGRAAFRLNSSNIKIHQTSAADLLLNVSNQQNGSFFCRLSLPIKLQAKSSSSRAVAQRILVEFQQY